MGFPLLDTTYTNVRIDSTCRVLNHHLSETPQSQWQPIQMSNLVYNMLHNIKQKYDTSNPEEVRFIDRYTVGLILITLL
jgi:hypothetical protein